MSGLFASRTKYVRQMPGRLVGETVDAEGKRGFVLTLSTREQHIRREKATSNICTNSGLCTLAFTIHLSLLGEAGLRRLARINHANALVVGRDARRCTGRRSAERHVLQRVHHPCSRRRGRSRREARRQGILGGVPASRLDPGRPELRDLIIVASTEVNTDEDRAAYATALKEVLA